MAWLSSIDRFHIVIFAEEILQHLNILSRVEFLMPQ